jgi:clan AA aspartic protease (TIGR02281 family)
VEKKDQKRIADLEKQQRERDSAQQKSAQIVAAWREAYVQSVGALRKAWEEAPQKIVEWKKKHPDIQIEPLSPAVKSLLDRTEASMATSEISLEADKTVNWVDAIVAGKPLKMILDPGVGPVRLSAHSADALGIATPGTAVDVTEEVAMENGQKLPARRVTLKTVQVGPMTTEDLECLIFLNGYDTPPILGAGFLSHFAYWIDPEGGKLTLTRVELKSATKPGVVNGLDKKKSGSAKHAR